MFLASVDPWYISLPVVDPWLSVQKLFTLLFETTVTGISG
jgi:hypothetical protein